MPPRPTGATASPVSETPTLGEDLTASSTEPITLPGPGNERTRTIAPDGPTVPPTENGHGDSTGSTKNGADLQQAFIAVMVAIAGTYAMTGSVAVTIIAAVIALLVTVVISSKN